MKVSDLKNMPVISLNDGVKVGNVSDLTLDATNVKVGSLLLDGEDGTSVVPFSSVRHIGTDAVTIDDSAMLHAQADHDRSEERGISTLTGLPVVNQEGTIIGSVDDLEFDEQYGWVTAVLVHHGGLLGIGSSHEAVPSSAIRGIGPKMVTVDTTTAVASTGNTN